MFSASHQVTKWLYAQGVDPDTQYLPDIKFYKKCQAVLVNLFNYKPLITQEQFFRYGFAEMKMLLCVDFINLVKRKHKELKINRNLTRKRSALSMTMDTSRFSKVQNSFRHGQLQTPKTSIKMRATSEQKEKPQHSFEAF